MKILCNRSELNEAINTASKAVSTKATLPVLEGLLLIAESQMLTITGNNLDLCIKSLCAATVNEPGSVVVNAKMFADIIRKLPEAPVTIETDKDNVVKISCMNVKYSVAGLFDTEFPKTPDISRDFFIKIKEKDLKNIIKRTVFSVSLSEKKPVLTGSLFEIKDDVLSVTATDGYRLSVRKQSIEPCGKHEKFIIPGKTQNELLKVIGESEELVDMYFTDKHLCMEFEKFTLISRLVDGEYVNFDSVIPKQEIISGYANVDEVASAIERASLIIDTNSAKVPLRWKMDGSVVYLRCESQMGQFSDEITIETNNTEKMEIGFNYKYLLDALKACDAEAVKMTFNTPTTPLLIKPAEGEEFLYMILPVRL